MSRQSCRHRNPGPLAVAGMGAASGLGLGTGFALANAALVPMLHPSQPQHNPKEHSMSRRLPPNWAANQARAKWMGPRMRHYIHDEHLSAPQAMKRAAADWRELHMSHTHRNPDKYEAGELVRVKGLGNAPGRVIDRAAGRKKGFLGIFGGEAPKYRIATFEGAMTVQPESQIKRFNPSLAGIPLPLLLVAGLLVYGAWESRKG